MQNFFKLIGPIASVVDLQIHIKTKGDIISVMVLPKASIKDQAAGNIAPLLISGKADELDAEFLKAILNPLQTTAGIVHNIAEFESGSDKLAKENTAAKQAEDNKRKLQEDNRKKYNQIIEKADLMIDKKNYKDALELLDQALEVAEDRTKVEAKIKQVKIKASEGSLFEIDPVDAEQLGQPDEVAIDDTNLVEDQEDIDDEENQEDEHENTNDND